MLYICIWGSFITEEIIEKLGITGRKLKLSLIVSKKIREALRCTRIGIKDGITIKLSLHHFVKHSGCKMRDIGVEEVFRKVYENDFCEEVHLSATGILGDMRKRYPKMTRCFWLL